MTEDDTLEYQEVYAFNVYVPYNCVDAVISGEFLSSENTQQKVVL